METNEDADLLDEMIKQQEKTKHLMEKASEERMDNETIAMRSMQDIVEGGKIKSFAHLKNYAMAAKLAIKFMGPRNISIIVNNLNDLYNQLYYDKKVKTPADLQKSMIVCQLIEDIRHSAVFTDKEDSKSMEDMINEV